MRRVLATTNWNRRHSSGVLLVIFLIAGGLNLGGCTAGIDTVTLDDEKMESTEGAFRRSDGYAFVQSPWANEDFKSKLDTRRFYLVRSVEDVNSLDNQYSAMALAESEVLGLVEASFTKHELLFSVVSSVNAPSSNSSSKVLVSYPLIGNGDGPTPAQVDWARPSQPHLSLGRALNATSRFEESTILIEEPKVRDDVPYWRMRAYVKGAVYRQNIPPFSEKTVGAHQVVYRMSLVPANENGFQDSDVSSRDPGRFGWAHTGFEENGVRRERGHSSSEIWKLRKYNLCEAKLGRPCSRAQIKWMLSGDLRSASAGRFVSAAKSVIGEWDDAFKLALGRTDSVISVSTEDDLDANRVRGNVISLEDIGPTRGILGSVHSHVNPQSGEILSSRIVIYRDAIDGLANRIGDFIDFLVANPALAASLRSEAAKSNFGVSIPYSNIENAKGFGSRAISFRRSLLGLSPNSFIGRDLRGTKATLEHVRGSIRGHGAEAAAIRRTQMAELHSDVLPVMDLASMSGVEQVKNLLFADQVLKAQKQWWIESDARGIHEVDLVEDAAVRYLMKRMASLDDVSLSASRDQIKDEISQHAFRSALLHMMGHAYGLTDNYAASSDKTNYHTGYAKTLEALEKGDVSVRSDQAEMYAYSSVMDHSPDFYPESEALGPYDRAAIQFAYGSTSDLDRNRRPPAEFRFCSTEDLNEDVMCRRGDRGASLSEITSNAIEKFQSQWLISHSGVFARQELPTEASLYRILSETMLPIRQVMDEFVYALLSDESVGSAGSDLCGLSLVKASLDAKELVNVCDSIEAESAGVDPTDLESFYFGLFHPASGQILKSPTEYRPFQMADYLYANLLAMGFFQDVIGSTEPGTYLAMPPRENGLPFTLFRLAGRNTTDEEKLKAFAEQNGIEADQIEEWVKRASPFVSEVPVGRFGKPFSSTKGKSGGDLGAFWDKYTALIALSLAGAGVEKYEGALGGSGNAFLFSHTRQFTTRLFERLILRDPNISLLSVQTRSGAIVPAVAEASLNEDMQSHALFLAFTDLVTPSDTSMLSKLRVCSVNEAHCLNEHHGFVTEYASADAQNRYRAVQTLDEDSIAYKLILQAKVLSEQRKQWLKIHAMSGEGQVLSLLELDKANETRASLDEKLQRLAQSDPMFGNLRTSLVDMNPAHPSAWNLLLQLTQNIDRVPVFTTAELANRIQRDLIQGITIVYGELLKLEKEGDCPALALDKEGRISPNSVGKACKSQNLTERRDDLLGAYSDLSVVIEYALNVLRSNINGRVAPYQIRLLSSQISDLERGILLMRRLMKSAHMD